MLRAMWLLCALLGLLFALSCEDEKESNPGGMPAEVRQAVEILFDSLLIDSTAEIFVVGPLPSGTVLREFIPDTTDTAATITLPNRSEPIYAFFINDHRELNWAHAVRYAWVVPSTGEVATVNADWPMFVDRPDGEVAPFSLIAEESFSGVTVRFGSGGGSMHDDPSVNKPADSLRMANSTQSLDAPCKKIGYMLDGGEWSDFWEAEGVSAGAMADNAGLVESFLTITASPRRAQVNTQTTRFLHSKDRETWQTICATRFKVSLLSSRALAKVIPLVMSSSYIYVRTATGTWSRFTNQARTTGRGSSTRI
jgi:hypothetical protein